MSAVESRLSQAAECVDHIFWACVAEEGVGGNESRVITTQFKGEVHRSDFVRPSCPGLQAFIPLSLQDNQPVLSSSLLSIARSRDMGNM